MKRNTWHDSTEVVETVPGFSGMHTQAERALLPSGEVVLAYCEEQSVQSLASSFPVEAEYVPTRQFVHTDAPVAAAYVPATQSTHKSRPVVAANLPIGHFTHAARPVVTSLYSPTGHLEQERAPICEYFPLPHTVQSLWARAPDAARTLPEGHPTHAEFQG